jgi:hypothetical protein
LARRDHVSDRALNALCFGAHTTPRPTVVLARQSTAHQASRRGCSHAAQKHLGRPLTGGVTQLCLEAPGRASRGPRRSTGNHS